MQKSLKEKTCLTCKNASNGKTGTQCAISNNKCPSLRSTCKNWTPLRAW